MNKGLLVNKVEGYELSASEPDPQTNSITFQIKGGLETVNLSEVSSGSVAGYASFVQETLSSLGQDLNNIVTVMVGEVNAIQTSGLDGLGREGIPFFELAPGIVIDKGASRGDYDVTPEIQDLDQVVNGTYSFTYQLSSRQWIPDAGQSTNADAAIGIPGLEFRIAGVPLDGDRFIVSIFDDAATGVRMGIRDGLQIAASSLFRVTPGPINVGALEPTVSFTEPELVEAELKEDPASVSATENDPVRVMSAGKTELILQIDPDNASSVSVDVLTRDGRHLVGEPDTAALTSVVGQSSFFGSGATYSDSYLNLSGASEGAYKDLEISYGAFGQTSEVTKLLPLPLDTVNAPATTDFAGGYIDFTTGTTDKSVLTIASDSSIDETEGAISIRNDAVYRGTGTGSEQIGTVVYPYGVSNPSYDTLRVTFSSAVTGINVPVLNEIAASFTYSARKDLTTSSNPVISNISVEAVTSDESEQFASVYDFNSADLIEAGRVLDDDRYRSELVGKSIPLFSGDGTVVVQSDRLAINGINLGTLTVGASGVEGYGRLSALDIKTWIDAASATDVKVNVRNEIFIAPGSVTLSGAGLTINGQDITSLSTGLSTVFTDDVDVVQSINNYSSTTGVSAAIGLNGEIILGNTNGANIDISSSTGAANPNLLGIANGTFAGEYKIVQTTNSSTPLAIEILSSGGAADLNSVGLDTSVIIRGDLDEDLGIFVRGSGDATVSSLQTESDSSFVSGLRGRVFDIEFTSGTSFQIKDRVTDTVLAERTYSNELQITYQGMTITLDRPAEAGDTFTIDGNNTAPGQKFDAQGNNSNLMRILDLESAGVVSGQSLSEAYLNLVGAVGNEATQAEISFEALEVLEAQAVEARDRVSGVSLDREAADLIRFQQAYQASAQIIQIATKIFDDMLRIQ